MEIQDLRVGGSVKGNGIWRMLFFSRSIENYARSL